METNQFFRRIRRPRWSIMYAVHEKQHRIEDPRVDWTVRLVRRPVLNDKNPHEQDFLLA